VVRGKAKRAFIGTLLSVFIFTYSGHRIYASILFGDQRSTLKVESGAKLHTRAALPIQGTLALEQGAEVEGADVVFDGGTLINQSAQAQICGTFLTSRTGGIVLKNGDHVCVTQGAVLSSLDVDGRANRLEGEPSFQGPITLHQGSELIISVQSTIDTTIDLNNALLVLDDTTFLGDDVTIAGNGTIDLNGKRLQLGGSSRFPWQGNLVWHEATDITLNGRTSLDGVWMFDGANACVNGNGNVLDIRSGGKIVIDAGTTLSLADVHLRGLRGFNQAIEFVDQTSELRLSNVSIELLGDAFLKRGNVYIEGPTDIILKDYSLSFEQQSKLIVDGQALTLDRVGFDGGDLLLEDETINFESINGGIVRHIASLNEATNNDGSFDSSSSSSLFTKPLSDDIELQRSVHVHPDQAIRIEDNLVIDGQGATIIFSNPDISQFVVDAGKTVVLKNIELARVNARTFDVAQGSTIIFGKNVALELNEDLHFSEGKFKYTKLCINNFSKIWKSNVD